MNDGRTLVVSVRVIYRIKGLRCRQSVERNFYGAPGFSDGVEEMKIG